MPSNRSSCGAATCGNCSPTAALDPKDSALTTKSAPMPASWRSLNPWPSPQPAKIECPVSHPYNRGGGARDPVILPVFKAGDPFLRGVDGGFDSHTLPPTFRKQKPKRRNLYQSAQLY